MFAVPISESTRFWKALLSGTAGVASYCITNDVEYMFQQIKGDDDVLRTGALWALSTSADTNLLQAAIHEARKRMTPHTRNMLSNLKYRADIMRYLTASAPPEEQLRQLLRSAGGCIVS
ncbi:MAG: hypothetical protein R6V03_07815 [Kiritimatiellia bacterium]